MTKLRPSRWVTLSLLWYNGRALPNLQKVQVLAAYGIAKSGEMSKIEIR